jgi:drug/metabolite transporter (DMT)-like permease
MSPRGRLLFLAVSIVWGIPYLLIKVGVDGGIPPVFLAWLRFVLGALILLPLARRADVVRAVRQRARWLAGFAAVELAVPFPLIAFGEQHIASSLAAIIIAASPLFAVLLALRLDTGEQADGRRLAGLVIGLAGVMALVGIDVAGRADELIGAAAVTAAALGYAVGAHIFKRHLAGTDARAAMGVSLAFAACALTPAAIATRPAAALATPVILAVITLGIVCTGAGLTLFGMLIAEAGVGRALVITYINPIVALMLGMAMLGERPGVGVAAGLPLILLGSWLSTLPDRDRSTSRHVVESAGSS